MKGINPGRLNKKVNILRYIEAEDELANIVSTLSVQDYTLESIGA